MAQPPLVPASPSATSEAVRRRMQATGSRDTAPELALRRALHRRGHRYRVDHRPIETLRRRADLVFVGPRVAVFVDGCFWHCCPEHGRKPSRHAEYWGSKLQRNVERDRDTNRQLRDAGWTVVRVWEHEDVQQAAERVEQAVRESRKSSR